MAPVLKHMVIGLAFGAAAALLLVGAGTILLLSVVFGFWSNDADMLAAGAYSGWCYGIAPVAGIAAFPCGVLGSLVLSRVHQQRTL